jgi:hypothetical protein
VSIASVATASRPRIVVWFLFIGVASLLALPVSVGARLDVKKKPKPKPVWTETYTERTLLKKLRIPCRYVRNQPSVNCDVASAQAMIEERKARVDQWTAACEAKPIAQERLNCLTAGASLLSGGLDLEWNLDQVSHGFSLTDATCVGSGAGIRFHQLRCKVAVEDRDKNNTPGIVSGRILVTVTGKSTFRWSLI